MAVQIVKVKRPAQAYSNVRPWIAILIGMWVAARHFFSNLLVFYLLVCNIENSQYFT